MTTRTARWLTAVGATLVLAGVWRISTTVRDHMASWGRTFHKTMTREAGPAAIVAPFDRRATEALGVVPRAWRKGDAFFPDLPDPASDRILTYRINRGHVEFGRRQRLR